MTYAFSIRYPTAVFLAIISFESSVEKIAVNWIFSPQSSWKTSGERLNFAEVKIKR